MLSKRTLIAPLLATLIFCSSGGVIPAGAWPKSRDSSSKHLLVSIIANRHNSGETLCHVYNSSYQTTVATFDIYPVYPHSPDHGRVTISIPTSQWAKVYRWRAGQLANPRCKLVSSYYK
jgi:hypothetical protein